MALTTQFPQASKLVVLKQNEVIRTSKLNDLSIDGPPFLPASDIWALKLNFSGVPYPISNTIPQILHVLVVILFSHLPKIPTPPIAGPIPTCVTFILGRIFVPVGNPARARCIAISFRRRSAQ